MLVKESTCLSIPSYENIQQSMLLQHKPLALEPYQGKPCYALQLEPSVNDELPANITFVPIRQLHTIFSDDSLFLMVSKAKQLLHWECSTRFCGCCGQPTHVQTKEYAKKCYNCNTLVYPQISPVVLALVYRDKKLLLGRSSYFLPGIYSIIAGYVEPGEYVENAVMREVKEEVGIDVHNITYFGSQPWPFPSSLMLGFFSEYVSGNLQIYGN